MDDGISRPDEDSAGFPGRHRGGSTDVADRSFPAAIALTVLGALLPGSGFWLAGRRLLGAATLVVVAFGLGVLIWLIWLGKNSPTSLLSVLTPMHLAEVMAGLIAIGVAWMAIIVFSHLLVRPGTLTTLQRGIGVAVVTVLCVVVGAPFAVGARYAYVSRDFITHVFKANPKGYGLPKNVTASDPWGGQQRVNILLMGGDGGLGRIGVRTDSMVLASIDTQTGNTVLFSLPRNLEDAPFPPGSPLAKVYPNGFEGPGNNGNWLLNAIYRMVPLEHPGILGPTDNEGADALKMSVGYMLGIKVDYYVLINLQGFVQLVNALGGITVNIDQIIPIGGNLDSGQPPTGWIQPGPDKHLDGFQALWFARGRWNTDDYHRMERQRCVINAVIKQANPMNVFLHYQQIASAGEKVTRTDIPQKLLVPLVNLALKVKDAKLRSVVFQPNAHFNPADPNFAYMRSVVKAALNPTPSAHPRPIIQTPKNVCAYHPGEF